MRKIKLVISDLHVGKGHILPDGSVNVLEEFYFDDKLAEFLDYYSMGEWAQAEVELVINGDFLNLLQTDYKGHHTTVLTETIDVWKVQQIIQGHKKVFEAIQRFIQKPNKKLTYIIGNHDQGMLWPKTRQILDEACGTKINYKNIVYFFDGIHIEHGHQHEAANRIDPKKFFLKQDLVEPILNLPWASYFFVNFVLKLKERMPYVDKVRPFHAFIWWGLLNDFFFSIRAIFELVWYFLVSGVTRRDKRRQFSLKNSLQIMKESAIFPDLEVAARKILNDDRVHTVIFGHTHVYVYRQWGHHKEYINTGTWTELTSLDIASLGKITKLTYVLIEYPIDGGRPRARLKEWRGHYKVEFDVAI
ncbi:MAG: metallophosphoesterase [Oligoflexia bacterium]|nr:metallophosphoesterase [Oligoflexia bacterium]